MGWEVMGIYMGWGWDGDGMGMGWGKFEIGEEDGILRFFGLLGGSVAW